MELLFFVSFFRPYLLRNFYRIYQPIQDQCPTTDEKRYHHRLVSRKKMIPFSTQSSYTVNEFEHFMSQLSFAPFSLKSQVAHKNQMSLCKLSFENSNFSVYFSSCTLYRLNLNKQMNKRIKKLFFRYLDLCLNINFSVKWN